MGPAVQKYLPDDLNPKIKEQLENEMGAGQGAPPGPPPPAASSLAAPAPVRKQAANGTKKKSESNKPAQQQVHQAVPAQRGQPQAQDHALPGGPSVFVITISLATSDVSEGSRIIPHYLRTQ